MFHVNHVFFVTKLESCCIWCSTSPPDRAPVVCAAYSPLFRRAVLRVQCVLRTGCSVWLRPIVRRAVPLRGWPTEGEIKTGIKFFKSSLFARFVTSRLKWTEHLAASTICPELNNWGKIVSKYWAARRHAIANTNSLETFFFIYICFFLEVR